MRIIQATEVVTLPRGRKAEFEPTLLKAVGQIKPNTFGVFEQSEFPASTKVTLPISAESKTCKADRAKVAGLIRKHWEHVHGPKGPKVSVMWTLDGFPQVGTKPTATV